MPTVRNAAQPHGFRLLRNVKNFYLRPAFTPLTGQIPRNTGRCEAPLNFSQRPLQAPEQARSLSGGPLWVPPLTPLSTNLFQPCSETLEGYLERTCIPFRQGASLPRVVRVIASCSSNCRFSVDDGANVWSTSAQAVNWQHFIYDNIRKYALSAPGSVPVSVRVSRRCRFVNKRRYYLCKPLYLRQPPDTRIEQGPARCMSILGKEGDCACAVLSARNRPGRQNH